MKKLFYLITLLLFFPWGIKAQTVLSLNDCRMQARENFPKLEQTEMLQKITNLKNENTTANYLPSIELKGQASYQSDVTSIDLPDAIRAMGLDLSGATKDQYKIYLDVKQTIWDGGITHSQKELEQVQLQTNVQKLEIEVWQAIQLSDGYFFGILMVDKNIEVLKGQQKILKSQIEKMDNAVKLGAAREKEKRKLEMELLQLDQEQSELFSKKKSFIDMLNVLTGQFYPNDVKLKVPEAVALQIEQMRPEMKYFDLQKQQLNCGDNLLKSSRNPVFFGFGQAGYGKPGFNMLQGDFSTFYIVGVGLNWRVTDWKTSRRNREINAQNREIVGTLQNDFLQRQNLQKAEASEKISNLRELLKTDGKLVDGRKAIADDAAAELQNGSITSTDYLIDLNAATIARLNLELHKIQLVKAIVNYNSILGY